MPKRNGKLIQRLIWGCLLGGFILLFGLAFAIGGAIVLNGGAIQRDLQGLLTRWQLRARQDDLHAPFSGDDRAIRFDIAPGANAASIAENLRDADLIRDRQLFVDYAIAMRLDRGFQAGVYFLRRTQSIAEIAHQLTDLSRGSIAFRIVAGWRMEEIGEAIDSSFSFEFNGADFLAIVGSDATHPAEFAAWAGIPAGASLEGFLYPETYRLPPDIRALELRDIALANFRDRVGERLRQEASAQGFSLFDMVTLASIIEREAVWPDEHAMIASVYRNRLDINMKLEADPTVQYGLQGARGSWWSQITRADYQGVISPYNTYIRHGLPPGPIANPSLSAIEAAIKPAQSPYFYFRAACDKSRRHNFAISFAEHLANGC